MQLVYMLARNRNDPKSPGLLDEFSSLLSPDGFKLCRLILKGGNGRGRLAKAARTIITKADIRVDAIKRRQNVSEARHAALNKLSPMEQVSLGIPQCPFPHDL